MLKLQISHKQGKAFECLSDKETNELVFGGGARGGKSFLGSIWIITSALKHPGSAWLVGRRELKALKRTTLRTFFKVMRLMNYKRDTHYHYNAQDMILTFANGSVVFFAELKRIPSDPEFDRIGSYDLTGAWLDEAQEIVKDAKDALQFRFTVTEGEGWSTIAKTLYTCNPSKGWIYRDFWKPIIKEGKAIEGSQFITSLYKDNPYIDQEKYRKNVLRTENKVKIQRLLHGNFEYDDTPNRLFSHDSLIDLFTNEQVNKKGQYLTVDVARYGNDETVITHWHGWEGKIYRYKKKGVHQVVGLLKMFTEKYGIPRSHVVVDEDGVGGGVVDHFEGCKGS